MGCIEITGLHDWDRFKNALLDLTGANSNKEIDENKLVNVYFESVTDFPALKEETP